jgi:chaperonin GroES
MTQVSYQPLEDRLLVRPLKKSEDLEKTDGGILLPTTVKKDVSEGVVYRMGPGRYAMETGQFIPNVLGQNDHILYGADQGMPLTVTNDEGEKEEMRLLRESDVLMVIKKEDVID